MTLPSIMEYPNDLTRLYWSAREHFYMQADFLNFFGAKLFTTLFGYRTEHRLELYRMVKHLTKCCMERNRILPVCANGEPKYGFTIILARNLMEDQESADGLDLMRRVTPIEFIGLTNTPLQWNGASNLMMTIF